MNPIEEEWHPLKTYEIARQMFEDEYDVALPVMDGIKDRSVQGDYDLERFIFSFA